MANGQVELIPEVMQPGDRFLAPPGFCSPAGSRVSFRVRVGVSSSRSRRAQSWCPCCRAQSSGRSPSCTDTVISAGGAHGPSSSTLTPASRAALHGIPTWSRSVGSPPRLSSSSRAPRQPHTAATCTGVSASVDLGPRERGGVSFSRQPCVTQASLKLFAPSASGPCAETTGAHYQWG